VRARIVTLLRERAASTTELATALDSPKGTVGHHLKVLEKADLIRVVRTRKVRALTEKYYGRVARLFVLQSEPESRPEHLQGGALSALMLRQSADELLARGGDGDTAALVNVRLTEKDRRRFERRLNRLVADYQLADDPAGSRHALVYALYPTTPGLPPRADDDA
jgi:DNA-binding transcriptional ArsR family regulator